MKRSMLLVSLLFAACEAVGINTPDPAIPSEFAGEYTLMTMGGATLPGVIDSFVDRGHQIEIRVVEGSIVLRLDGTLNETHIEHTFADGEHVHSETLSRDGTWVTDQEQIDVTWEGRTTDDTTYLYDDAAGELWLDMDDAADVWRYQKNE